jgi:hypothetical protein
MVPRSRYTGIMHSSPRCDIGFSPFHPTHRLLKLYSFARHPVSDQDDGVLCQNLSGMAPYVVIHLAEPSLNSAPAPLSCSTSLLSTNSCLPSLVCWLTGLRPDLGLLEHPPPTPRASPKTPSAPTSRYIVKNRQGYRIQLVALVCKVVQYVTDLLFFSFFSILTIHDQGPCDPFHGAVRNHFCQLLSQSSFAQMQTIFFDHSTFHVRPRT